MLAAPISDAEADRLCQAGRRAALTRGCTPQAADDAAQEALARLMVAARRLDPAARLPFVVTTARNLAVDGHRQAGRQRRNQHRLVDLTPAPLPDEQVLSAERSHALGSALGSLAPADRQTLISHAEGTSTAELAEQNSSTPGAVAARLTRTRARLRLDYVLALRKVTLPTPVCRPVLLAISAADTRRQRALDTAGHLARCVPCVELVPPLQMRRSALAGIAAAPLVMLGGAGGRTARTAQHPAVQAAAAVGVVGTVAAAVVLGAGSPGSQQRPRAVSRPVPAATPAPARPTARVTAQPGVVSWLQVAGGPGVALPGVGGLAGQRVVARMAPVQSVVSYPGFWIGTSAASRVYVHLTHPETVTQPVRRGSTVSFTGIVVAHRAGFAHSDGVLPGEGAALLDSQGVHIETPAASLARP